jgi:hypothetical protein
MVANPYIGKVLLVELPGNKRPRYKWIVRLRDDGRYIVRSPKIGVPIKDLAGLKDSDYGKETLLPIGAVIIKKGRRLTRKASK